MNAVILSLAILAVPSHLRASPENQSLYPVADGVVHEGDDRNDGSSQELRVRHEPSGSDRSFLRFDVKDVTGAPKVLLRLHCTDYSRDGGRLFLAADNGWTESDLVWSRQPAVSTELVALGPVFPATWISVDVSPVVTRAGTYVFALSGGCPDSATFSTRESLHSPRLILESRTPGAGASDQGTITVETLPESVASGIWTSAAELASLPRSGAAWNALLAEADKPLGVPDLSDQDDDTDVRVLAKALAYARTGKVSYRYEVALACLYAIGTERGGETLALGRNLGPYVIAADLVGLPAMYDVPFRAWLQYVLTENLAGRTLQSTHQDRPNNWGTHAGASRAAVAIYLGDTVELANCALVFKGWLGDRSSYKAFEYGDLSWQADPSKPVGINPVSTFRNGHSIDGVLPDDQRRAGGFTWPPPQENYVWEALQGAVVQAVILHRAGYDTWNWEDRALLRAVTWLHDECGYPATGDDTWQPHLINHFYGTSFPAPVPSSTGKNMGFTDWTHAP